MYFPLIRVVGYKEHFKGSKNREIPLEERKAFLSLSVCLSDYSEGLRGNPKKSNSIILTDGAKTGKIKYNILTESSHADLEK